MKIFIAASWLRRKEAMALADTLRAAGHAITARWLSQDTQAGAGDEYFFADQVMDEMGVMNEEDVRACEALVVLTGDDRAGQSRGGKNVELGMAVAWCKRILVLGPVENIYSFRRYVRRCASPEELLEALA